MVIERKNFLFSSTRIILDDEALEKAFREKRHSYISGLSYVRFDFGPRVRVKSKKTPCIALDADDEDLLKKFSDTTRNEIRRTFKMEDLAFQVPDNNREGIYAFYKKFETRGGRIVRQKKYFEESLCAGAYVRGVLVAALLCYQSPPYLRVNAIVSERSADDEIRKYTSFASRRLIFELCRYGREHGFHTLDLGGVNLVDEAKAGITAFKNSFGGELCDEYTYTYQAPLSGFFMAIKNLFQ